MLEVFRRLGSIQFDPLAVAGRTHDLVLHARVAEYDPAWCDLLYERREIFEAYNKGLSLVPTCELPWFRVSSRSAPRILAENADVAERVLEASAPRAPCHRSTSSASAGRRPTGSAYRRTPSARCSRRTPSRACSASRDAGNRRHSRRRAATAGRRARREIPLKEQLRHKLLSRYRAHGLLGVGGDIFGGIGPAKPDPRWPGYPGRTALREELVATGELVPVEVENVRGKRFVLREEVDLLERPPEPPPSVAFLPPFDPLVWDRSLLGSLFDFEYVWELFLPPANGAGVGTCCRCSSATASSAGSSRDRPRRRPRAGARPLVGGRLRATPRAGLRRRDARRASRLPALRLRDAHRVGARAHDGETTVSYVSLDRTGVRRLATVRLALWRFRRS